MSGAPGERDRSDAVRLTAASEADLAVIGGMLEDFNREYDEPAPPAEAIARRVGVLIAGGDTAVLIAEAPGPIGLALMRFRASLWDEAPECYLAELYVAPERRGEGYGRALLGAVIEHARSRGATYIDLNTGEDDTAARGLYESFGFSPREGRPDGSLQLYYEREI